MGGLGIRRGGKRKISPLLFSELESIHSSGTTNTAEMATNRACRPARCQRRLALPRRAAAHTATSARALCSCAIAFSRLRISLGPLVVDEAAGTAEQGRGQ